MWRQASTRLQWARHFGQCLVSVHSPLGSRSGQSAPCVGRMVRTTTRSHKLATTSRHARPRDTVGQSHSIAATFPFDQWSSDGGGGGCRETDGEDENAAIRGERVDFIPRYAFLCLPSPSPHHLPPLSPCELAALTLAATIQITFIICTDTNSHKATESRGLKSSGGCTGQGETGAGKWMWMWKLPTAGTIVPLLCPLG